MRNLLTRVVQVVIVFFLDMDQQQQRVYHKEELIQLYDNASENVVATKEELMLEVWELMKKAAGKKATKILWRMPERCKDFEEDSNEKLYFFIKTELDRIGIFRECRLIENNDRFGQYTTLRIAWDHNILKHCSVQ